MTWVTIALVAAAILGLVNVIDSHLISKRMPSIWAFFFVVGIATGFYGIIILALNPLPEGVPSFVWFVAGLSVASRLAAILAMLFMMRTEEVSRVIPVVYTYPIFVAIMAIPLLGETLGFLRWLAIAMTVLGAVLVSMRFGADGSGPRLRISFGVLMVSSLLLAAADTAAKYVLESVSFWNMYSITAISFGALLLLLSARPSVVRELAGMPGRTFAITMTVLNEVLTVAGSLLSFWAIQLGPVSLVSTVVSTRPLFVFLFALALSLLFPASLNEFFSRRVIALKLVSAGLIVGGITLINLTQSP
ncbi:MAG: DMT family transporter [Dehalococcoidia bacterium]|nr:DMT family transporter [Dehalococcoidia bacterium]